MKPENQNKTVKIVIVGGGFGGVKTALKLADVSHFDVKLISDETDFRYYPTLYKAATGSHHLSASFSLSEILEGKKIKFKEDTINSVDTQAKFVTGKSSTKYHYDILVLALGVVTNFFGIKGLEEYAYGIKTLAEAQRFRDHLHKQLIEEKKPDVNYIIIGGGPTGVELAGMLPGYIQHIMRRHGLDKRKLHVEIIEAAPRILPRMPKMYSRAVAKRLHKLGVVLKTSQKVEAETADNLTVNGQPIPSHTVVWTAGVTNHPFFKNNQFNLTEHGKVLTDQYLQADNDIFVIGDNADTPYSGMAQTALYDGEFVAENIKRRAKGKSMISYKPDKPIYVTPVGEHWAAVLWGKLQFYGWLGWLVHEAADAFGKHDLEPWPKSSKHWLADFRYEESCPLCAKK